MQVKAHIRSGTHYGNSLSSIHQAHSCLLLLLLLPEVCHYEAASRHVSVATVSSPFARMSAPTICSLLNPMLARRWNLRHDSAAQWNGEGGGRMASQGKQQGGAARWKGSCAAM